jgi:diacylglycerol O-acyltransferase / wax synthase
MSARDASKGFESSSRAVQVGGLDTAFLSCETPSMHMHVGGLVLLEPCTTGGDPFDRIRSLLLDALPSVPLMHKRLAPAFLGISRPYWIDDTAFDLDLHLHRVSLGPCAGDRALARFLGEVASRPLHRDRPLWEAWYIAGLSGGRVALFAKMHHAVIDGVTGVSMMGQLFGFGALGGNGPVPQARWRPQPSPGALELFGLGVLGRLRTPLEVARLLPATAGRLGATGWNVAARRLRGGATVAPFRAPRTSFNATLTPHRTVAFTDVPLNSVKTVKDTFGVRFNDVVATVVGGALRHYLLERAALPERPLVAAEPVAVHAHTGALGGVSKLSVIFSTLATDVAEPVERLRVVAAANARAKEVSQTMGADTFARWTEQVLPGPLSFGARLYSRLRLAEHHPVMFNVLVSNVAGPPLDLYMAGNHVVGMYAFGPIIDGAGLNVTVLSSGDRVGIGVVSCPDLAPDVWALAGAVSASLDELVAAATLVSRPTRRSAPAVRA